MHKSAVALGVGALGAGILAFALAASAQTPAPNEGRQQAGPQLKIDYNVEYARPGGQSLKLNLYRVTPSAAPLPIVIWIHGLDGALQDNTASPATALANNNGYAVASIEYRKTAPRAAQLADVKAAVRWLKANSAAYNLDPAHVGVIGYDVGGTLAALAGTTGDVKTLEGEGADPAQSSRVQAVVDIAGPTGGSLSPITYVTADDAPTLIFHGSADAKVSSLESQKLIAPLKVAGINSTLDMQFGVDHSLGALLSPIAMQTTTTFLNQHLKGIVTQGGLSAFMASPPHSYVDPIGLDIGGTLYKTYATPARGPNTFASYRIYLPPGYDANPARRYPVVYFVHGRSVDSKRPLTAGYIARADAAIRSGVMPPTIFVLVQGDNIGWYLDAQDNTNRKMESVIIKDLIPHVDKTYRTIATRNARAIEGHSMGGYGALHLGFKYPDLFSAVTGNAPALVEKVTDDMGTQEFWDKESPTTLAKQNTAKLKTQSIRIIVGTKDGLFPVGKQMDELLTSLQVKHEFFPVEGSPHNHDQLVQYETFDTMAFYGTVFGKLPNR